MTFFAFVVVYANSAIAQPNEAQQTDRRENEVRPT